MTYTTQHHIFQVKRLQSRRKSQTFEVNSKFYFLSIVLIHKWKATAKFQVKQQLKLWDNSTAACKGYFSFFCQISTAEGHRKTKLSCSEIRFIWSAVLIFIFLKLRTLASREVLDFDIDMLKVLTGSQTPVATFLLPVAWLPELEQFYYVENYDISEFENVMLRIY